MKLGLNPNEIRLEAENFRLRSELQFYRRQDTYYGPRPTIEDAATVAIEANVETLRRVATGGVKEDEQDPTGWHVFGEVSRREKGDMFRLNYYVSERSFRNERDMFLVLQHILEQSAKQLAKHLMERNR